jgi:hypothetical protein
MLDSISRVCSCFYNLGFYLFWLLLDDDDIKYFHLSDTLSHGVARTEETFVYTVYRSSLFRL